jgi:hypothetical protein
MPKYTNRFSAPASADHTILDSKNRVVGTIRIKPSSVLWKGRSQKEFHRASLDEFIKWILDSNTKAAKTKS